MLDLVADLLPEIDDLPSRGHQFDEMAARWIVLHRAGWQRGDETGNGLRIVPRAAFAVTQGATRSWPRTADSGRAMACFLCPTCGARLWHARDGVDTVSVKAGSLDAPVDFAGAVHIWTSRRLAGVVVPGGTVS